MMQRGKSRISAAPPQSPQLVVIGLTRPRARAHTAQTKDCGDCGGSQDFAGFPADSTVVGPVLALQLGQTTGWPVRNSDGAIASNIAEFELGRFERDHGLPPVRAWLEEVDEIARGAGAALALLYWTLAQGGRR
jgi:hypothetical protein